MNPEVIKIIGEPYEIKKSYIGCYIGLWKYTNQEVINLFKKKGYIVRKWANTHNYIIANKDGLRLLDVFNIRGEYFAYNVGEDFAKSSLIKENLGR